MKVQLSDHFTYKKLFGFVIPTICMMTVTSVYSVVDGFFVSNFVGKNALAAVNIVIPILLMLSAFGFMIGTGGSALAAKTIGEGNRKDANRYFSMLTYSIIIFAGIVSVIGFILMPQIAKLLGASDKIMLDCIAYGRISFISLTFFMLQNSFQSFLVTAQKAKLGLFFSIISGVNNVILDYLLVYKFQLGIKGAAYATMASEILGGLLPLLYFASKNSSLLRLVKTKFELKPILTACSNGISEMLTNISISLVSIIYNRQLMKLAAENGVSAYGVIMYVSLIFMAFFFGYSIGINPIAGYNYGAKRDSELKNVLKKSLIITACASAVLFAAAFLLSPIIAEIFVGYDAELFSMTANAMKLYSTSFLLCGFNIFTSAFFTGLNNGKISGAVSFLRTLVFQILCVSILPALLGINGIWISVTVSEILTLFFSAAFLIANRKKYRY